MAKAKEDQSGHSLYGLEANPYPLDRAAYKRRNVIERMFCRLKNWRRVATRYDRLARNYLSGLALAAIIIAWT
jgi:transposase